MLIFKSAYITLRMAPQVSVLCSPLVEVRKERYEDGASP